MNTQDRLNVQRKAREQLDSAYALLLTVISSAQEARLTRIFSRLEDLIEEMISELLEVRLTEAKNDETEGLG